MIVQLDFVILLYFGVLGFLFWVLVYLVYLVTMVLLLGFGGLVYLFVAGGCLIVVCGLFGFCYGLCGFVLIADLFAGLTWFVC